MKEQSSNAGKEARNWRSPFGSLFRRNPPDAHRVDPVLETSPKEALETTEEIIQEIEDQGLLDDAGLEIAMNQFNHKRALTTNSERVLQLFKAFVREKRSDYRLAEIALSENFSTQTLQELFEQGIGRQVDLTEGSLDVLDQFSLALNEDSVKPFALVVSVDEHTPEDAGDNNPLLGRFSNILRADNSTKIMLLCFSSNLRAIPMEMKLGTKVVKEKRKEIL